MHRHLCSYPYQFAKALFRSFYSNLYIRFRYGVRLFRCQTNWTAPILISIHIHRRRQHQPVLYRSENMYTFHRQGLYHPRDGQAELSYTDCPTHLPLYPTMQTHLTEQPYMMCLHVNLYSWCYL